MLREITHRCDADTEIEICPVGLASPAQHHNDLADLLNQTTRSVHMVMAAAFGTDEGTSLEVQRLRLCTSTAGAVGSIPGGGTKIPHAPQGNQKR